MTQYTLTPDEYVLPLGAHQPALPGFPHPHAGRRRPRGRKGESWVSWCIRSETWRAANRPPITREEHRRRVQENVRRRELYFRKREVYLYRVIERAKCNVFAGAGVTACPHPVFFWFGGHAGRPGPQSQYINRATLNLLERKGVLDSERNRGAYRPRVNLGRCKYSEGIDDEPMPIL